MLNTNVKKIWY